MTRPRSREQRHHLLLRLEPAAAHQVLHRALVWLWLAVRRRLAALAHVWRSLPPPLLRLSLAFRGTVKRRRLRLALCSGSSDQPRGATLAQAGASPKALRAARRWCNTRRCRHKPRRATQLHRPCGAAAHADTHASPPRPRTEIDPLAGTAQLHDTTQAVERRGRVQLYRTRVVADTRLRKVP